MQSAPAKLAEPCGRLCARSHPADIVYTADVFDKAALDLIVQHNIPVNIGSPDMINQLGEVAPGRNITLRINPALVMATVRRPTPGSTIQAWYLA